MRPSIARGLATLVVVASLGTALSLVWERLPAEPASLVRTCEAPVEIHEALGTRVGCVGEPALQACGVLQAGAAVRLHDAGCTIVLGGMRANTRLTYGRKLDANTVTASELELLEGVGPKLAHAIVRQRESQGRFGSLADLDLVPGVGPATRARLEAHLEIASSTD